MVFKLNISRSLLLVLLVFCFTNEQIHAKVFHFTDYGAVEGGKVDISEALLKAWGDACKWKGKAQLVISSGIYLVQPVVLQGPCNGPVRFRNKGILRAPMGLKGPDHVIVFQYVDGLTIDGGGSFDGQGYPKHGSPNLTTLLSFNFVTNSKVGNVKLINSQSTHFDLFGCNNTEIHKIRIASPSDSPNTDGIKLGVSQNITISDSNIASGDDCIALLTGSFNINITGITCGPGHGISIGSLGGQSGNFDHVEEVLVRNCSFYGTSNGVRIKTKATNNPGLVTKVNFEDLVMYGVDNPIIIDQNYCPPKTCSEGNSRVQISEVKYINVKGTSKANVAVNFECSKSNPCKDIELKDIDITYDGLGDQDTISKCSYASGNSHGKQVPKACI